MSGHGKVRVMVMTIVMVSVHLWCGCSSTKSSARADEPTDREVLYSPPAEDGAAISVPGGAPLLDDYGEPIAQPPLASKRSISMTHAATSRPGTGEVTRADLEVVLAQGPGWGLVQVKVRPIKSEGGKLLGYEVFEFTPDARVWMSPGLAVGDQITHVNGVQIRTPDDYMQAWNLSQNVDELRIDYIRDGEANYSSWLVVE